MAADDAAAERAALDTNLRLPAEELRLGVVKRVIEPGTGPSFSTTHVHVMIAYSVYVHEPSEDAKRRQMQRRRARRRQGGGAEAAAMESDESSDEEPLTDGSLIMVDSQKAVAVTTGIDTVVPGLEIGLLSMREGQRAIIEIPADVGFPSVVAHRVPSRRRLVYDLVVKSALPVRKLACGSLMFTMKEGANADEKPTVGDTVTVLLRRTNPITQTKLKSETLTFNIGTPESGPFDNALMSMSKGTLATVFIDRNEHMLALQDLKPSSAPVALLLKPDAPPLPATPQKSGASAADASGHRQCHDPRDTLETDPSIATSHYTSPLPPVGRLAAIQVLRDTGRRLFEKQQWQKAVKIYHRAATILLADPALPDDAAVGAEAREVGSILFTNCGRASMRANNMAAALEAAQTAVTFNEGNVKAQFMLAQSLRHNGRYKAALEVLDKCATLDGVDTEALRIERGSTERLLAEENASKASAEDASDSAAAGA